MEEVQTARSPMHLWIVGLLSLVWNAYGCFGYIITKMRNTDVLSKVAPDADPNAMLAWTDSFPFWAQFGWGLGVWMGLIGSILLLMRHRWAVPAFGLSLLGAVPSLSYQTFISPPPPPMSQSAVVPVIIILVAAALLYYAHAQRQKGVLR